MAENIIARAHQIFAGLTYFLLGALVCYIGFMFVSVQLFGNVEFEK